VTKLAIPEAVLTKHTAVVGMTGSGKTSTSKLLIEQVAASGSRVCILDPIKSDWWGLTSNKAGTGPGLPFQILGGPHGHVPLHADAGEAIAKLVADGKLPLSIIDMADFGPGGLQRFFNHFAPALVKKMRGVLYLVIEEAHEFCPKEKSGVTGENMSVYYAKKLATAGRSKGVRLVVATQRVQALHNAVLSSCETVIVHRMTYPADQEPVTKWLKGSVKDKEIRAQIEESMPNLADGEGWICSGSAKILERIQFPRIHTFDNSATPEDDDHRTSVVTAKVDVTHLRAIIGDAVKDAEANDPAALKKRIAELEREAKSKGAPSPADLQAAEQRGFERGCGLGREAQRTLLAALSIDMEEEMRKFGVSVGALLSSKKPVEPKAVVSIHPQRGVLPATRQALVKVAEHTVRRTNGAATTGEALPKGEAAVLAACIQFPDGLRREQLTVLTAYKRSSRDAYIQRLRERGLVECVGELVTATDDGRDALPNAAPLPTGVDLQEFWRARLPEGERKILDILIERQGESVARADLDELTGYQRSSRDAYLQRLRAKQLVVEPSRGEVRASENLFT
jgi:hypothetical protein